MQLQPETVQVEFEKSNEDYKMQLTVNLLLYYTKDMKPCVLRKYDSAAPIYGIRHFIPNAEALNSGYVYIAEVRQVLAVSEQLSADTVFFLVNTEPAQADLTVRLKNLSCPVILFENVCSCNQLMNRLSDIDYHLSEWDKRIHTAVLDGKNIQDLIDGSEDVLVYPAIAFDASFDVIGYTKTIPCSYRTFQKTVRQGYTDAETMQKLKRKQLFTKIGTADIMVAPAADDDDQFNIYTQFVSGQTFFGYFGIFCGYHMPEPGYLDLIRIVMNNMSIAMEKRYKDHRFGQMMYETILCNLINVPFKIYVNVIAEA